jgi:hypothetical protein
MQRLGKPFAPGVELMHPDISRPIMRAAKETLTAIKTSSVG